MNIKSSERIGTDAGLHYGDRSMDDRNMGQHALHLDGKKTKNHGYEQFDINDNIDTRSERAYTNNEKKSDYRFDESRRIDSSEYDGGLALSARQLSEGSENKGQAIGRLKSKAPMQNSSRQKFMERGNSFSLRLSQKIDELIEGY